MTEIGSDAFSLCRNLATVTIPNSVTTIGNSAFYGCSNLTSINIPSSVTAIGKDAFSYCISLPSINIPSNITTIECYTFYNCLKLASVTLPNSITNIEDAAFSYCKNLNAVNIPSSVKKISSTAFDKTGWIDNQPDGVVYAGDMAYTYKGSMENEDAFYVQTEGGVSLKLYVIHIQDGTTSINESAFSGRTELGGVTLPNSLETIGNSGFYGCYNLGLIDTYDNYEKEIGESEVIHKRAIIPDGVTTIGSLAFSNCINMDTLSIPNSVTDLGEGAFYGCISLSGVDIPNSVTIIPSATFSGCTGLKKITIPESVDSIGPSAFASIKPDTIWCYAEEVPKTADKAFDGVTTTTMKATPLLVPSSSLTLYKASTPWKNFKLLAMPQNNPSAKELNGDDDADGIHFANTDVWATEIFDLSGRRQNATKNGLQIVRMSDGTTRKVIKK